MRFALAAACLTLMSAAQAEPATPQGAKAIADAYAAYLSAQAIEKGVVSVKPDGDDYVVAFDLEKAVAAMGGPAGALRAEPFSYRLTPTVNGGWLARANGLPGLTVTQGGEGGGLTFDGFRFDGLYDPGAADFFVGKIALPGLRVDVKTKSGEQIEHILVTQDGGAGDIRLRAGEDAGSIDLHIAQSAAASLQKTTVSGEGGAETPLSETRQGAATGEGGATGFRAKALGELWRFFVAHAQDKDAPAPEKWKPLLEALAPLWRELSSRVEVNDVAVAFPGGRFSFKSAFEELRLTGLVDDASMSLGLSLRDVSAEVAGTPDWLKAVWPASLALKVEGGVEGLDRAAQMTLDDPEFLKSGKVGDETQKQVTQLLAEGRPHAKLTATRLTTPLIEATFEGEAAFDEEPEAHGRITADSLDKVLATLAKLTETEPEAQQFLYLVTFVRGLARNEGGRLVWDIEYVGPNAVKVNGQTFPPPAPGEDKDPE